MTSVSVCVLNTYPRSLSLSRMPSIRIGTMLRVDAAPTMPHMALLLFGFHRPRPAFDGDLLCTRERQRGRRCVARDRAAPADRRVVADLHRRHEHAVAPDVRVV